MSEISRIKLRYQIFHGGEVIDLDLSICPEKITLRPADNPGTGLRLDIIQYHGDNLAWFVLPTHELSIELS